MCTPARPASISDFSSDGFQHLPLGPQGFELFRQLTPLGIQGCDRLFVGSGSLHVGGGGCLLISDRSDSSGVCVVHGKGSSFSESRGVACVGYVRGCPAIIALSPAQNQKIRLPPLFLVCIPRFSSANKSTGEFGRN